MLDLAQRVAATERGTAQFRGKPFGWIKRRTCIHLARSQGRAMGHTLPSIPDIRSPKGARRALAATGHADLASLLDSLFPRIAPASMWIGDLALMEGADGLGGIVIAVGGKVMGYHADHLDLGLVNIEPIGPNPFLGAWRL